MGVEVRPEGPHFDNPDCSLRKSGSGEHPRPQRPEGPIFDTTVFMPNLPQKAHFSF